LSASQESSGRSSVPLAPEAVLQQRYRIVRQLGRGGMGAVYEAVDQRLGMTVALKETVSSDAAVRKQFEHEARLLAAMNHPALPRVSDYFAEGDRAFLVMEFIAGADLARIIAQQPGPFPRDQVISWADQLLDALIYLHTRDRQVIHRDIKPHNIKLTASGQIALLDFGLAKTQSSDTSNTSSSSFFGYTRQYAPLEQIQDRRTDTRSDIYALGATLYHLLTGVKPPDALLRAAAVVNGEVDPLRPADEVNAAVGYEIAPILAKAMAQKAEDRFISASEFREALRRVGRRADATDAPSEHHDLKLETISDPSFGPGTVTLLVATVLLLGAGLIFGFNRWTAAPRAIGKLDSASSRSQAAGLSATQERTRVEKLKPKDLNSEGLSNSTPQVGRRTSSNSRRETARPLNRAQAPVVSVPRVRLPALDLTNESNF